MCGIAGLLAPAWPEVERVRATDRMLSCLRHRGPDDSGIWSGAGVTLGQRRLAILDIDGGHQPMESATGQSVVVFGGEIYNFREIRDWAKGSDYVFRTAGDTETILAAFERSPEDFPSRLNGMFAFALWAVPSRTLVLARDRLGEKPLLIAQGDGWLAFASELPALLTLPGLDLSVDAQALDAYLAYKAIPAPLTIYKGVRRLHPGEVLVAQSPEVVRRTRYWSIWSSVEASQVRRPTTREDFLFALRRAVSDRMEADVPLGAFLSGGIDSGLVTAVMSSIASRPIETFSIGFDDPDFDELSAARETAKLVGSQSHEITIRPDLEGGVLELAGHFGEPFGDSSALPVLFMARTAKHYVTVALSGDGGDELFGGYERYVAMQQLDVLWSRRKIAPARARSIFRSAAGRSPGRGFLNRAGRFLEAATYRPEAAYARLLQTFDEDDRARTLSRDVIAQLEDVSADAYVIRPFVKAMGLGRTPAEAAMIVDYDLNLPTTLLAKTDIATMAASLEARAPLLDYHLVEASQAWPIAMKIRGRRSKWIARELLGDMLTTTARAGSKQGFDIPVDRWLRTSLRPLLTDSLASSAFRSSGLIDTEVCERLLREHITGKRSHGRKLWCLMSLAVWLASPRPN